MKKIRTMNNMVITIIMVVILLVALSTATYAWFSASNVVNLSRLQFTVGTDNVRGDLKVSWNEYPNFMDNEGKDLEWSLTLDCDDNVIDPAMPNVAPYVGMSVDELTNSFYTGTSISVNPGAENQYYAYRYDGVQTAPARVHKEGEPDRNNFYLYNINPNFDLLVTLRFYINNDVARYLHVAVFVDGELEGIIGYNDKVHYGNIVGGQAIDSSSFVNQKLDYNSKVNTNTTYSPVYHEYNRMITSDFGFVVSDYNEIEFVVWFDGMNINDNHALSSGSLMSISFNGEYIEKA